MLKIGFFGSLIIINIQKEMTSMKIFDSELRVLEVLWEEQEIRASQVCKILEEKIGWNRNTTYTVIKKCIEKGYIERTEPHFVCKILISKKEVQKQSALDLVDKLFGSSKTEFVKTFLEEQTFTQQEKEEIKKIVNEWN